MKKDPLILSFDFGTQSVRAMLVDKKGNLIGKSQVTLQPYRAVKPDWAEQDAEVYEEAFCKAARELKAQTEDRWADILAMTVTTIRDTCVCLDENGKVLRPIILWMDQRKAKCERKLPLFSRLAFWIVGMSSAIDAHRKITKANWIAENEPEIWAKTAKYVQFSCFVNHFITGEIRDSVASCIAHVPMDYKRRKWKTVHDIQFPIYNVTHAQLPELIDPGEIVGYVLPEIAKRTGIPEGLPLIATGADKGCEALGTGSIYPHMASLSFGSAASIDLNSKKYHEPQQFLPAYPSVIEGQFNLEVQVYRGYWMVTWFKNQFANREQMEAKRLGVSTESLLEKYLDEVPAGSRGLILQPYWTPGLKIPEGKGSIIGFSDAHDKKHLYRAIIEGIAFGLYDGLVEMEMRTGIRVKELTVSGGGSQSDAVCQINADVFGLPVKRIQTYETSGLGSAMAGFVALGEFSSFDEAIKEMVHYTKVFYPNPEKHKVYERMYRKVYVKMYGKLKRFYKTLSKYSEE